VGRLFLTLLLLVLLWVQPLPRLLLLMCFAQSLQSCCCLDESPRYRECWTLTRYQQHCCCGCWLLWQQ
jgi:hypothetical protein